MYLSTTILQAPKKDQHTLSYILGFGESVDPMDLLCETRKYNIMEITCDIHQNRLITQCVMCVKRREWAVYYITIYKSKNLYQQMGEHHNGKEGWLGLYSSTISQLGMIRYHLHWIQWWCSYIWYECLHSYDKGFTREVIFNSHNVNGWACYFKNPPSTKLNYNVTSCCPMNLGCLCSLLHSPSSLGNWVDIGQAP